MKVIMHQSIPFAPSLGMVPGSAKFANAPPPGLTWRANAPKWPGGGGGGVGGGGVGWAQVELTDALSPSFVKLEIKWPILETHDYVNL